MRVPTRRKAEVVMSGAKGRNVVVKRERKMQRAFEQLKIELEQQMCAKDEEEQRA